MIRARLTLILNFIFKHYLSFKYKNFEIGKNVRIDWNSSILIYNNKLELGNNVYIHSFSKGYHAGMPFPSAIFIDVKGASVKIGSETRIHGCYIHAQKQISIGSRCVIASGVQIIDSNGHNLSSSDRTKGRDIPHPIVIGDNVWIGLNSIILKGSIIGTNSVVSASSVVKGVFPPNSLISGNPAQLIRTIKIEE